MPHLPHTLLRRFPLVVTSRLTVARRETSRFWPPHESTIIGPERYSVTLNRALLGDVAVTFTHCTARVRVVPLAPSRESCLILPLSGAVEIETDRGTYQATAEQPLFRAPVWLRRFEATPARCLMVDVPVAVLRSLAGEAAAETPLHHMILQNDDAAAVAALAVNLSRLADRSRRTASLQRRNAEERRRLLPRSIRRAELRLVALLARLVVVGGPASPAPSATTPRSIEESLRQLAGSGLPITTVARRAGLSVRALQRSCASRGYTPLEFMRAVQLDRAHDLLSTATEGDSVAGVAHAVGLMHPGRFSDLYRRRFGEPPSATLARALRSSPGESGT